MEVPQVGLEETLYALNLSAMVAGRDFCAWLRILTSIDMVVRALGGSMARKLRAVLPDLGLKGEKAVVTEVRYLVSIVGGCCLGSVEFIGGVLLFCLNGDLEMLLAEVWFAEERWRWRSCGRIGKAATAIDGEHRFHMTSTLTRHTSYGLLSMTN